MTEDGYLNRKDFFDILMVIQLKSKLKLLRDVKKNQRQRVRLLEKALEDEHYQAYYDKTMQILQKEFDHYERQFQKILDALEVSI